MFHKITAALALFMLAALTLTGCAGVKRVHNMFGKPLVYEKDGFPDEFAIRLDENGKFSYYEGGFSSYVEYGIWELNSDTLTLRDMYKDEVTRINRFKVTDSGLVFLADNSDNFRYVKVSDGEHFYITNDTTNILV